MNSYFTFENEKGIRFLFFVRKFENEKGIRYPFFVRKFESEKGKNGPSEPRLEKRPWLDLGSWRFTSSPSGIGESVLP